MTDEITPNRANIALDDLRALESASAAPVLLDASSIDALGATGIAGIMVPDGYSFRDITDQVDRRRATPWRATGTIQLGDLDSFIAWVERTSDDYPQATIRLTDDSEKPGDALGTVRAVFNDYNPGEGPGWGDFVAAWTMALSPSFKAWRAQNATPMKQAAFAGFIEHNIADVPGEEGGKLLAVALSMQAKNTVHAKSAIRLDNGEIQFLYSENVDAKAGPDGKLAIPGTFKVQAQVLKGGAGYSLTAKLRYRIGGEGGLMLWYEFERLENLYEAVMKEVTEHLVKTGLPVFRTS